MQKIRSPLLATSLLASCGAGALPLTRLTTPVLAASPLAVNMHLYWTGVARTLRESGDPSLEWLLRESVAGEVFAAGHAETGNDLPVLLSTARAERVDGGY